MKYNCLNEEVLYTTDQWDGYSCETISFLKELAEKNCRKRARICFHRAPDEELHEMLIVHKRECYIRPHSHMKSDESIFILEGQVDVLIFDHHGNVREIRELGDIATKKQTYLRNPSGTIHTLNIHSEFLVFKETTTGPFNRENMFFPDWAPPENSPSQVEYKNELAQIASRLKNQRNANV